MNFKSFSKVAAVSAIAMTVAMHAAGVVAAPYIIGQDVLVPFTATVDNSIDVAVTPGDFGDIAVMNSNAGGDIASAILVPDILVTDLTDDHSTGYGTATQAHIVGSLNSANPATVAVTSAFFTEDMYVTFTTCTNLTGPGPEVLRLSNITTSMGGPAYDCVTPMATGTTFATDAGGTYTFYVGATISTDGSTDVAYTQGAYAGSVAMQITY